MRKKLIVLFFALLMAVTLLPSNASQMIFAKGKGDVEASNANTFFKDQLDKNATVFYNALESLYSDGSMKTGTGSYDLSSEFTQEELQLYANGGVTLAKAFQSARDAFDKDHPEIFYVDFSKVSLRLGVQNNKYLLYLSNGSYENYYAPNFTSKEQIDAAIAKVNAAKKEIDETLTDTIKSNPVSIITHLHNKLIEMSEYTYPTKEDRNVSNIYGLLVNGKANCDGYSRTFKWLLDDYNIPNILVAGVGKNAKYNEDLTNKDEVDQTMNEYHQWNYVQVEDQWYAVDVTWDDPIKSVQSKNVENTSIRTTYFMLGSDKMNENHFPMGEFSEGSQVFTYPVLSKEDYYASLSEENLDNTGDITTDLKVTLEKVDYTDDDGKPQQATKYRINYKNMSVNELKAQGLYVAVRFGMNDPIPGTDKYFAGWQDVDVFKSDSDKDSKSLLEMTISKATIVQACLTTIPQKQGEIYYPEDLSEAGNHILLTKTISTPYYSDYVVPPFIRTSNPVLTQTILPKKTTYEVEFYEELEVIDSSKPITIKINNTAEHIDATASTATLRNGQYTLPYGETRTSTFVKFDFTPDSSFQGYANVYNLQVENVRGVHSKKAPKTIPVITTYEPIIPCPMRPAGATKKSAFVMSNPTLVVDENQGDIFTAGDKDYGNLNIALVATKTEGKEKEELDALLGATLNNAKASSTYELNLGCASLVAGIKPGYHVSIGVPYPPGFHPLDYPDVEFRAYHFKKVNGVMTPVEIICQITPSGLMIIAEDFSPFTIVAYDKKDSPAPESKIKDKAVTITAETGGGSITTTNGGVGTYPVAENTKRTFEIKADEGYMIDRIILNDIEVRVDDKDTYTATFDYKTMNDNNQMQVYFVSKSVVEKEKEKNIEAITPVLVSEKVETLPPAYLERTLSAKSSDLVPSNVSITNSMIMDADLSLSMDKLAMDVQTAFQKYNAIVTTIASGTPSLSKSNAMKDTSIVYTFDVDTKYNGKELTLLTWKDNKVESKKLTVSNGEVKATISGLYPFALIDEAVNIKDLEKLVEECDKIVASVDAKVKVYTTDSYESFKKALKKATDTLSSTSPTEIKDQVVALSDAKAKLVDVTALKAKIKEATDLNIHDYTEESYEALSDIVKEANKLLTNGSQKEVEKAIGDIEQHIKALEARNIATIKKQLSIIINEANTLKSSSGYYDINVIVRTNFETSLTNAELVLAKYKDLVKEDANALKEMQDVYDVLVESMQYLNFTAHKEALQELYDNAVIFNQNELNKYEDDIAMDRYLQAFDAAKTVLDNPKALDEMIQNAYNELTSAKAALKLKVEADVSWLDLVLKQGDTRILNKDMYDVNDQSWKDFLSIYERAKTVDRKNQVVVDQVADELSIAIKHLRMIPNQEVMNQLKTLLDSINKVDFANYSKEDKQVILDAKTKITEFMNTSSYTEAAYQEIQKVVANVRYILEHNVIDTTKPDTNVGTGDTTNITLFAGVMVVAASIIVVAIVRKRKKDSSI